MESFDFWLVADLIRRRQYVERIGADEPGAEIGLRRAITAPLRRMLQEATGASHSYVTVLVRSAVGELVIRIRSGSIRSVPKAVDFLLRELNLPLTDSPVNKQGGSGIARPAPSVPSAASSRVPGTERPRKAARRTAARKMASMPPVAAFEVSKRKPTPKSKPTSKSKPKPGVTLPVWFGTDRLLAPSGDAFLEARGDSVTFGRVDVFVPESHKFGELGSSFLKRLLRGELRSDALTVTHVETVAETAYWSGIAKAMRNAMKEDESSHAIIFIHGFNVNFDEAARRTAQIGTDLKITGPVAFFSWPSFGTVGGYMADEATVEGSVPALRSFLERFLDSCGSEKVHVIAHSMGNRALIRAVQDFGSTAGRRFGQIILAAPDIDRKLFTQLAVAYAQCAVRTTLYASRKDRALDVSARLHRSPRAGYYKPYTVVPGVDSIAVSEFNVDLLGHDYFASAAPLLFDIFTLLRHNAPPTRRQRIRALLVSNMKLWELV